MGRIREICTIDGRIWAVREFDFSFEESPHALLWSQLFYDWKTGEVWGRRTLVPSDPKDQEHIYWQTFERAKGTMDMTHYREVQEGTVPLGLLAAAIVGRGEKFSSPIIPQ